MAAGQEYLIGHDIRIYQKGQCIGTAEKITDENGQFVEIMKQIQHHRRTGTLTKQQAQTIKGQALHGDLDGARRGITNIINRKGATT